MNMFKNWDPVDIVMAMLVAAVFVMPPLAGSVALIICALKGC